MLSEPRDWGDQEKTRTKAQAAREKGKARWEQKLWKTQLFLEIRKKAERGKERCLLVSCLPSDTKVQMSLGNVVPCITG